MLSVSLEGVVVCLFERRTAARMAGLIGVAGATAVARCWCRC